MLNDVVLDEILEERMVSSRGRRNPRGVKRKMSKWPIRATATDRSTQKTVKYHIELLK